MRFGIVTQLIAWQRLPTLLALRLKWKQPAKLMTNYRELADEHDAATWFSITPRQPENVRTFDMRARA